MNPGIFRINGANPPSKSTSNPISIRYSGTPNFSPLWLSNSNSQQPIIRHAQPCSVQFGDLFFKYTGKWVESLDFRAPTSSGITRIFIDDLEGTTGNFINFGGTSSELLEVSAPELKFVGANMFSSAAASITRLYLPKLQFVNGFFFFGAYAGLTEFSFPSLIAVNQMSVTINAATVVSMPSFQHVQNSITITANAVSSLEFPAFTTMASSGSGVFTVNGSTATTLSLPSLYLMGGTWNINNSAALTTLTLPALGNWKHMTGNIGFTLCALNQTSVNNVLAALAYMDGTNGTTAFGSGRTVTITGTSAAPSNAGSTTTAGSNFVCAGTTCTVNWTAHGYATGDVLRISGITTATNANRYAVITVVNANQFTYTITSQNATGAGTATVVKANADAKALVTRGVTLTTN